MLTVVFGDFMTAVAGEVIIYYLLIGCYSFFLTVILLRAFISCLLYKQIKTTKLKVLLYWGQQRDNKNAI